MIECYLYFYDKIATFLKSEEYEKSISERVKSMHDALRGALQVVTVELEGDDDPQVIFETLNARGEPLLPSDLLRNSIFLRASQHNKSQEKLYEEFWVPFDDEFWHAQDKQGRMLRPRSDIFLQHYLTLQRKREVLISHLYNEYKEWIKVTAPFPTVRAELEDLSKYRINYQSTNSSDPGHADWSLFRILAHFRSEHCLSPGARNDGSRCEPRRARGNVGRPQIIHFSQGSM